MFSQFIARHGADLLNGGSQLLALGLLVRFLCRVLEPARWGKLQDATASATIMRTLFISDSFWLDDDTILR